MAERKVSELPDLGAAQAGDEAIANRGGQTGRVDLGAGTDQTARDAAAAAKAVADAALPKAGGTMTGKIILDGAPSSDLHAATKKYVDDNAGDDALTDAQIGDKAFSNPPTDLSGAEQGAVRSAIGGASEADARYGLFELSERTDNAVWDTLNLNERNVDGLYAAGTKFYVSGGDAGGLRGKVIRRNSVAYDHDAADHGFAKYWEVILDDGEFQAGLNADAIGSLEAKTADLHAGEIVPAGWRNAPSTDGGLDHGPGGSTRPNQAYARAVSAWTQEVSKRGGYLVARISATLAPAQARVRYVSKPTSSGRILRETFLLSGWRKIGSSADAAWDYYVNPRLIGTAVATLDLETTSDSEHLGTSRFSGVVDGSLEDGLVDEDALAKAVKDQLGVGTDQTARDSAASAQAAATAAQTAAVAAQTDATRALADSVTAQTTADAALPKAGGTMTGKIVLDGAPSSDLHAATKKYVDDNAGASSSTDQTARDAAAAAKAVADAALPKAGGTMTGKIVLDGAPTADLHAASKKYVDDHAADFADGLNVPQWSTLSGTIKKGAVVEHNDFYFISRVEHEKQSTGPDGDPANWWDLGEWWGVLSTKKYYPEGATGKTGAGSTLKIWRASEFVHDTDPLPTEAGNTKWKLIWSAELARLPTEVARLKLAANDIVVGEKIVPGWAAVNASGAEGGLWYSNAPNLAAAKAATYAAPTLAAPDGGAFFVARIPTGSDPRQYIMREPSSTFGDIDTALNGINHIGSDDAWDYYENGVRLFGNISLRSSSHTTGVNTWAGKLGAAALEQVNEQLPKSDARKEQVWFDAEGSTNQSGSELTPRTTTPIVVEHGEGDAQFISGVSGNDFTLAAGHYLLLYKAMIDASSNHTVAQVLLRQSSDNTVLESSSTSYFRSSGADADITKIMTVVLDQDTAVNLLLRSETGAAGTRGESSLSVVLLSGDPTSVSALETQVEELETEVTALEAQVDEQDTDLEEEISRLAETVQENYELLHKLHRAKDVTTLTDPFPAVGSLENLIATERREYDVPAARSKASASRVQGVGFERGVYELTESNANQKTGSAADAINSNSFVMEIGKFEDSLYTTYGAATHHSLLSEIDGDLGEFIHNPLSAFHAFVADNDINFYLWVKEDVIAAWRGGTPANQNNDSYYSVLHMQEADGTIRKKVLSYPWHNTTSSKATINGVVYRRLESHRGISQSTNWLRTLYENNPGDSDDDKAARTVRCWFAAATTADGTDPSSVGNDTSIGDALTPAWLGDETEAWTQRDPGQLPQDEPIKRNTLLWEHTAEARDWHPTGVQLGAGVSTAVYNGLGGDDPWTRLEAEVKWTETRQSLGYEHIGLITFPGWRSGSILPARPVRLHGQGRFGGLTNTSTLNAILSLVSRNDERTNPSHLFIENFNPGGDTGIVAGTDVTVRLWGVR